MAGCTPQTFIGITLATKACLEARGAAAGIPVTGNTGQATTMGVTVQWNYDPTTEILVLHCTDAPFFVPCSTVTARINELVEGCKAQSA